jgi:hypothetical protein
MLEVVFQPEGSRVCGHCCVAMITGASLSDVYAIIGHRHGTSSREIAHALQYLGHRCDGHLHVLSSRRLLADLPSFCMAVIKWTHKTSHWVVHSDGLFYCPAMGMFPLKDWPFDEPGFFSSYMEIDPHKTIKRC